MKGVSSSRAALDAAPGDRSARQAADAAVGALRGALHDVFLNATQRL